jgi:hypothetical protein
MVLLNAQSFNVGLSGGLAIYNGDLAHHSPIYSKNEKNSSFSFSVGYDLNDVWKVSGHYLSTSIEGSDEYSSNEQIRSRNLHFVSQIREVGVTTEMHFLKLLNINSKIISPFLSAGVGVFHFNPKAEYEGKFYELQKLSTEGQGLPGNNSSPYQLIEMNAQLGAGIAFKLSPHFRVSLSSSIRLLSTDFLDDVSGTYYDINSLAIYKGEMAAHLAYRSSEFSNDLPESIGGKTRGNPFNNDSYLIHQLTFTYIFSEAK